MSPAACADPVAVCSGAGTATAATTGSLAAKQAAASGSSDITRLGAAVAETEPVGQRWHHFVSLLATETGPFSAQTVEQTLAQAIAAARGDFQWRDSGLVELLMRAHEAASSGFANSARMTALGLLDFAKVVQQFKASVSSGQSDGRRSSGSSSGDEVASATEEDDVAPSSGSKRRRGDQDKDEQHDSKASKAMYSSHQRRRGEALATWSGPVRVQLPGGSGSAEFCRLSMQVPEPVLAGLPRHLEVSSIQHRKAVAGMAGVTCSTCITSAGAQQAAELRKMAQLELVAIVRLEDCGAILVPYLTEAGHLKAVTFLAAME